jgi:hypothetical protein
MSDNSDNRERGKVKTTTLSAGAIMLASFMLLTGCTSGGETQPTRSPSSTPKPVASGEPTPGKTTPGTTKPSPSPTSQPTPTTKPAPAPAPAPEPTKPTIKTTVVEIGADELRFENLSGQTLQSFSYYGQGSPIPAIAATTKLYGYEPKVVYTGEDPCFGYTNVYTWDNFVISFVTETKDPAQVDRFVAGTSKPNQNYDRVVQAPNGAQITFNYKKYVQANPSLPHTENKSEYPAGTFVEYQKAIAELSQKFTPEQGGDAAGTIYGGEDDKIKFISAPGYLYGDC